MTHAHENIYNLITITLALSKILKFITSTCKTKERGRRKTRKGDIFTSIRRRFSKGRSHSVMGEGGTKDASMADKDADDVTLQRSISADRHSMASTSNNLRLGLGSAR